MEKNDTGGLRRHVLMNRHHMNTCPTQRFEYRLQFRFTHGKIAVDHRLVITPDKGGPGIDPHGIADLMAMHRRGPPNGDFVHPVAHLALHTEDVLNGLRVQGRLWRLLKGLGTAVLRDGVYLLSHHETLQRALEEQVQAVQSIVLRTAIASPVWRGEIFGNAFFIFLLRQFFLGLPQEISDVARVDGAGELRIFWQIMLPLVRPALMVAAFLSFIWTWHEFFGPLIYLSDRSQYPLSLGLCAFRAQHTTEWGLLMAASTLTTLPLVVLFLHARSALSWKA